MAKLPPRRPATYADLEEVPEPLVAEILDGELVSSPRPAARHARASIKLAARLVPPFDDGVGGPGGWIVLIEPEVHLGANVLVPDLAAWRRERMPELPDAAFFTLAPDWVCEVLSPSTEHLDRTRKLRIYAEAGVPHAWLLDPARDMLEAYRLVEGSLRLISSHDRDGRVALEPFDAIALELAGLWSR